jgi:omega-6 fatty acid desaturase (delta-12 desaturase)
VEEYDALTPGEQRAYVRARRIGMAPLAGFLYLVLNPRLTWITGTAKLVLHVARRKWAQPRVSMRAHATTFQTHHWKSAAEYRHMSLNNFVLLSTWALMGWLIGPALFFTLYLVSTSLAGAGGIVLFTVQHNFEHAYASGDQDWDFDAAALHGTSFLVLPAWLNWFTANIGYHHIHHLSSRIPNHRLVACHTEHAALFADVRRLTLADIGPSLKFILWDTRARRIISIAEHQARNARTTGLAPGAALPRNF